MMIKKQKQYKVFFSIYKCESKIKKSNSILSKQCRNMLNNYTGITYIHERTRITGVKTSPPMRS